MSQYAGKAGLLYRFVRLALYHDCVIDAPPSEMQMSVISNSQVLIADMIDIMKRKMSIWFTCLSYGKACSGSARSTAFTIRHR